MYIRRTSLLLALLFMASFSFAQTYVNNTSTSASNEAKVMFTSINTPKKTVKKTSRFHKRLSGTFSGFAIELTAADLPLERNYPLFRQFGNVHYDKLREGGYSYVIKTDFTSKAALKRFYENVILPKNDKARMVEYKLGKRNIL